MSCCGGLLPLSPAASEAGGPPRSPPTGPGPAGDGDALGGPLGGALGTLGVELGAALGALGGALGGAVAIPGAALGTLSGTLGVLDTALCALNCTPGALCMLPEVLLPTVSVAVTMPTYCDGAGLLGGIIDVAGVAIVAVSSLAVQIGCCPTGLASSSAGDAREAALCSAGTLEFSASTPAKAESSATAGAGEDDMLGG